MRVLELYSGIGGMHYAFQESGIKGEVVTAVDINTIANEVYSNNFPNVPVKNRNIQSLEIKEIKALNINAIFMSPPCQPFTRVGMKKDSMDNRSSSLFYILKIIPEIETLKYVLMENVKGFENSHTREQVIDCLEKSGFNYKELILSPCQFGIPNTRHRYYLLAKKKHLKFCFESTTLENNLSSELINFLPKSKHCKLAEKDGLVNSKNGRQCYPLHYILEDCSDGLFLIPDNLLRKRAWILDIRTSESNGSCCFTKAYGHYVEGTGSVYCPFSEKVIKSAYNECEKHDKSPEGQLQILKTLKLRYFTPKEVSRLMCFPEDFKFPENITMKQKYRLLGNSINVHVVSRLILLLCTELEII